MVLSFFQLSSESDPKVFMVRQDSGRTYNAYEEFKDLEYKDVLLWKAQLLEEIARYTRVIASKLNEPVGYTPAYETLNGYIEQAQTQIDILHELYPDSVHNFANTPRAEIRENADRFFEKTL